MKLTIFLSLFFVIATSATISSPLRRLKTHVHDITAQDEELQCTNVRDCHQHGQCVDSVCLCSDDYATFGECQCCHKRKNQLTAFFLQFFLGPFGAGFFYLGKTKLGLATIACLTGGFGAVCVLACIFSCLSSTEERSFSGNIFITICITCLEIAAIVLWIYGIVVMATGDIQDGDGISMKSW